MADKGLKPPSPYIFGSNSWFPRRIPVLVMAVLMGIVFIWSIDGGSIRTGIKAWRDRQDYFGFRLRNPINSSTFQRNLTIHSFRSSPNLTQLELGFDPNSTHLGSSKDVTQVESVQSPTNLTQVESVQSAPKWTQEGTVQSVQDLTHPESSSSPKLALSQGPLSSSEKSMSWISVELEKNLAPNLRRLTPGGEPCRDSRTVDIRILGLDDKNAIEMSTGDIHEFVFDALDDTGKRRCLGGDYFETDLSGEKWKSRPPVKDLGNGSYSMSIQVHQDYFGEYNLTVVLLFRHFEGLRLSPERFSYQRELRRIPVKLYKSSAQVLPSLQICKESDFTRDVWSGRWTRHGKNDQCEISYDGRYRCLKPDFPCQKPWCFGSLGSLESNGWVYSTHCSFKIFSTDSAWECLQNRWIFFWGDSNHVDSIRNLLNFVLGLPEISSVPRRFDMNFTNPSNTSQSVRITSIFNGHWNETKNYEGLNSLSNQDFQDLLKQYFTEETVPDTMIMNSGLHDGVYWKNIRSFIHGAEFAAKFWQGVLESVKQRGLKVPKFLYRTTIATGGYARSLAFNPQKMEAFNGVMLDVLKRAGILSGVIDDFDMTFPWHYDNRCNDGVHYGRPPAKMKWRDGEIGHQYFVDLMLGHVILNALCAR